MRSSYLLLVCMAPLVWASGARPVPAFQINLDLAPEDRFTAVVDHFETPLKSFYSHIVNNTVVLVSCGILCIHRPSATTLPRCVCFTATSCQFCCPLHLFHCRSCLRFAAECRTELNAAIGCGEEDGSCAWSGK